MAYDKVLEEPASPDQGLGQQGLSYGTSRGTTHGSPSDGVLRVSKSA